MVIRVTGTPVTFSARSLPCCVRLVSTGRWVARRAAGAPGAGSSWPVTPRLWGIQGEFLLLAQSAAPFWGSHIALHRIWNVSSLEQAGAVAPPHPFASPEAVIVWPVWLLFTSDMLHVSNLIWHIKEEGILIAIHVTERFTTVHFQGNLLSLNFFHTYIHLSVNLESG